MYANHLLVILLSGIWSAHFLLTNYLSREIDPIVTGFLVRLGTLAILTLLAAGGPGLRSLIEVKGAGWKLGCVGLLGFLLDITAFVGFRYSNTDTGTVLLKTDVLMANLITVVFFQGCFRRRDWLYTVIVLVGVFLVMGVDPWNLRFRGADIFFILSAFFVTLNAFLIGHVQRRHGVSNAVIAYYNNFFTLILFTLVMLGTGLQGALALVPDNSSLLAASCAAAATQTLIYLVYYRCLATLPVYIIKILLLLIPVFTMLFNSLYYWRTPSALHTVGSVMVLGSAAGILCQGKSNGKGR